MPHQSLSAASGRWAEGPLLWVLHTHPRQHQDAIPNSAPLCQCLQVSYPPEPKTRQSMNAKQALLFGDSEMISLRKQCLWVVTALQFKCSLLAEATAWENGAFSIKLSKIINTCYLLEKSNDGGLRENPRIRSQLTQLTPHWQQCGHLSWCGEWDIWPLLLLPGLIMRKPLAIPTVAHYSGVEPHVLLISTLQWSQEQPSHHSRRNDLGPGLKKIQLFRMRANPGTEHGH